MEALVRPLTTVVWNEALRRHPSLHVGRKYLFVVGAGDMMMDKTTYNYVLLQLPGQWWWWWWWGKY